MTGHPPLRSLALSPHPVTAASPVPPSARRGQLTGPDGLVSARVGSVVAFIVVALLG
jgi:hypothetical protein